MASDKFVVDVVVVVVDAVVGGVGVDARSGEDNVGDSTVDHQPRLFFCQKFGTVEKIKFCLSFKNKLP